MTTTPPLYTAFGKIFCFSKIFIFYLQLEVIPQYPLGSNQTTGPYYRVNHLKILLPNRNGVNPDKMIVFLINL
jgi:hypothetical protein